MLDILIDLLCLQRFSFSGMWNIPVGYDLPLLVHHLNTCTSLNFTIISNYIFKRSLIHLSVTIPLWDSFIARIKVVQSKKICPSHIFSYCYYLIFLVPWKLTYRLSVLLFNSPPRVVILSSEYWLTPVNHINITFLFHNKNLFVRSACFPSGCFQLVSIIRTYTTRSICLHPTAYELWVSFVKSGRVVNIWGDSYILRWEFRTPEKKIC